MNTAHLIGSWVWCLDGCQALSAAAAAAAKSLQSCPTLCNSIHGSPTGSPVPGILQARALEWVAISFSNAWKWKVKMKSLSHVRLLATPGTAAYQAPPSMGFSRQEYWSGVPLPSPRHCLTSSKSIQDFMICRTFTFTISFNSHNYLEERGSLSHLKNEDKNRHGNTDFRHTDLNWKSTSSCYCSVWAGTGVSLSLSMYKVEL